MRNPDFVYAIFVSSCFCGCLKAKALTKNSFINDRSIVNYLSLNHDRPEKYLIPSIIVILILIILYFFINYPRKINKKEEKEDKDDHVDLEEITDSASEAEESSMRELKITPETELKILNSLMNFEEKHLYINKNISLSFLATEFQTNSTYVSYVIRRHKKTDFKNYINTLRINYIIEKLSSDKKYRKYKISTLAEESGFSSHSKFTTIFKSISGTSPSQFIESLNNESDDVSFNEPSQNVNI